MFETLKKLEGKPKHVRVRFAFWMALSITALILCVWLLSFFQNIDTRIEEHEETESSFFGELSEVFSDVTRIPQLFKGTIEYEHDAVERAPNIKTIDLDALIASSTER